MGTTMMPTSPDEQRQIRQRESALAKANRIRIARARIKAELDAVPSAESCKLAADLFWDPPEVLAKLKVMDLLLAVRGVGGVAARRLLQSAEIDDYASKMIGGLTPKQRAALAAVLRYRGTFQNSAEACDRWAA